MQDRDRTGQVRQDHHRRGVDALHHIDVQAHDVGGLHQRHQQADQVADRFLVELAGVGDVQVGLEQVQQLVPDDAPAAVQRGKRRELDSRPRSGQASPRQGSPSPLVSLVLRAMIWYRKVPTLMCMTGSGRGCKRASVRIVLGMALSRVFVGPGSFRARPC